MPICPILASSWNQISRGFSAALEGSGAFSRVAKFFSKPPPPRRPSSAEGARLEPGRVPLMQPLADVALVHLDREAPRHLGLQILAASAHQLVHRGVRSLDDPRLQLGHRRVGQAGRAIRDPAHFRPSTPCAFQRCTQSLSVCRCMPLCTAAVWSARVTVSGLLIRCIPRGAIELKLWTLRTLQESPSARIGMRPSREGQNARGAA